MCKDLCKINRAKKYLEQAYTAQEKIVQCNYMLEKLNGDYGKLTASYGENNIGHSNVKHDISDYIASIFEKKQQIMAQIIKFKEKQNEISEFIFNLQMKPKDEILRRLLILKYIQLKSFKEIYQIMHYSYNYVVKTLHEKALIIVEKNLEINDIIFI